MNNPRELINQPIKGHYTPTELMNRSEISFTYKARDTRSQQEVILKYYLPLAHTELQEQLMDALRFQASHRGPRLVPVVDFGPHAASGGAWVVTERLRHPNLLRYVRSETKLTPEKVVAILSALCDALEGLHSGGSAHANLKPTNIFINDRGEARSVRVSDAMGAGLCGVHKLQGEPVTFNDPTFFTYEQAAGREVTLSTDIGALGLLGYFMLTGNFPFEGRTTDKVLASVIINSGRLKLNPEEFQGGSTALGEALASLLKSCFAKSASKRPASLSALSSSLQALGGVAELPPLESPAPQTIAPGDMGALFGSSGPQTMMYQSIDDDAMALLDAARAEFDAQHGTPSGGSSAPQTLIGGVNPFAASSSQPTSQPTQTSLSMGAIPLNTAAHEALTAPEPPRPVPQSNHQGAPVTLMGLQAPPPSTEDELPLMGGAEASSQQNSVYEEVDDPELAALMSEIESSLEGEMFDDLEGETTPPPPLPAEGFAPDELELPFSPPRDETPFPLDELSAPHVELFSEPARVLPPAPHTDERPLQPSSSAIDDEPHLEESRPSLHTLGPRPPMTFTSFETHLEGFDAHLAPDMPMWSELMALRSQPEALAEALMKVSLPLTGHLLPFSQFQLQIEGHRFDEPFFEAPVTRLQLPKATASTLASLNPMGANATHHPQSTFEGSVEGGIEGDFEATSSSLISARPESSHQAHPPQAAQSLPTSLVIGVLFISLSVMAYLTGLHQVALELINTPSTEVSSPVRRATPPPPSQQLSPTAPSIAPPQAPAALTPQASQQPEVQGGSTSDDSTSTQEETAQPSPQLPTQVSAPEPSKALTFPRETRRKTKRKASQKTRKTTQKTSKKRTTRSTSRKKTPKRARKRTKKTTPGLKSVF
jgi:serine/threonine-protein kinase